MVRPTHGTNTSTRASLRPVRCSLVAGSLLAISLGCAVVPNAVALESSSSVSAQPSSTPENQRPNAKNDDAQLVAAQQKAVDTINALPNLTQDQKKALANQVYEANTDAEIDQIVANAQETNGSQGQVTPAQQKALDTIGVLPNLTQDQKIAFANKVHAAKTDAEVNQIVAQAQQANDNNGDAQLGAAQQKAIDAINTLQHLSQDQKNAFIGRVQAATTVDEVNSIIKEAQNADSQAAAGNNNGNQGNNNGNQHNQVPGVDVAKQNAHALIQGMPNLAPWQKQSFKDRINAATSPDQVNKVLSEAMGLSANHGGQGANLNTVKDQAHALIQGMPHLSQDQKQSFQDRINAATSPDKVSQILSEAQGLGSGQVGVPAPDDGFRTGNAGTQSADYLTEAAGLTLAAGVALSTVPVIRRRRLSARR